MIKYLIPDGTVIYRLFVNCDKLKFYKSKKIYRGRRVTILSNGKEILSLARFINNQGTISEVMDFEENRLGKIIFQKKDTVVMSGQGYYNEQHYPNSFTCYCTEEQLESCIKEIEDKTHEFLKKQYEKFKESIPAKIQELNDKAEKLLNQYNESLSLFH